jgi:predicted O-methyltransferase YrrM
MWERGTTHAIPLRTLHASDSGPDMVALNSDMRQRLRKLRASPVGLYLNFPRRVLQALPLASKPLIELMRWSVTSREDTNYTYRLTQRSLSHLAHTLAVVTGTSAETARGYIREAMDDQELAAHVVAHARTGLDRNSSDARADFGKRLGWYAMVRILRPEVVIETGVDKGLGSVLLAAALLRNGAGRLYGTDIDPTAGRLLSGKYAAVAELLFGDSIESLERFEGKIDLFINDSDHSAEYEAREYRTIASKLSDRAVVLGDNAHATDALVKWSEESGRNFVFWAEKPERHWYPGSGIGISFPR